MDTFSTQRVHNPHDQLYEDVPLLSTMHFFPLEYHSAVDADEFLGTMTDYMLLQSKNHQSLYNVLHYYVDKFAGKVQ